MFHFVLTQSFLYYYIDVIVVFISRIFSGLLFLGATSSYVDDAGNLSKQKTIQIW